MTKAAHARTPQPLHPASVQPRQQESKGINGATLSGRQEFTDRRQSSQGGLDYFSPVSQVGCLQ